MNKFKVVMLAWIGLATLVMIASVGKEREPLTGIAAAITAFENGIFAWMVVNA